MLFSLFILAVMLLLVFFGEVFLQFLDFLFVVFSLQHSLLYSCALQSVVCKLLAASDDDIPLLTLSEGMAGSRFPYFTLLLLHW